ncbi:putative molybdenum cofactor biosynthesis protein [Leishmania braziliensis MHOM/BR/75/M2904]|uniref:Molybdenum cofactor biosynthesis protein n=3 Tax=Leishmania braziliensis TaxID=5660 RepID=A4HGW7_LEIBR|nr:putative molybdenum cofactor biosynthesis protein [Leishmania braziliensis MHOM/BR/75/M2904]KAI5685906.1 MoaC family [Leishmania braziliensis]CAJ2476086.1 unnamed protein product [Leishmania braziliensis]CAJ2476587.1 unnamed protein product [Leishmania braziliensis]CAM39815.2 putative molybdenum cofactor biosynthesis protein [Leishmania braziliensis MHOM/BR/75/M2904]SYZ67472.1 molybdenum_cofactor_biosynthesis_protein [Leishmania braziliensis MHOM/BR/75/M2904]
MKHLLTPATPPPSDAFAGGGQAMPSVSILEEYYTSKKGPLFATAVVAGTNAVKQVSSLVPFCYSPPIQRCSFTFRRRQVLQPPRPAQMPHRVVLRRRTSEPGPPQRRPEYSVLYCFCTVATENKGGVEMEALTGAIMASVTLYDMLKGLPGAQEDGLSLGEAFVLAKRGGRNDFTKLLMSEPDRPLVESGMRSGEATVHALPPSSGAVSGSGELLPTSTTHTSPSTATPTDASGAATMNVDRRASANVKNARAQGEEASEEVDDEEDHHPIAKRVIRRPTPAAAPTHGSLNNSAATGDADAWWHSSKHEKRLQELYPRRKYGDNARLVSSSPTPMAAGGSAARAHTRTNAFGTSDSGSKVPTTPATVLAARPKLASKVSMIRDGQGSMTGKGPTSVVALRKAAGRAGPTGSNDGAGEDDEEDNIVGNRHSPNRSRLVKMSARAGNVVAQAADYDDDRPADAAEAEEAEDEAVTTTASATDQAEEEEETAMTGAPKKRRSITAVASGHRPQGTAATKSPFGKRSPTGPRRYLAEVEDTLEAHCALGGETAEGEGAGEEERMPAKPSAVATTRRAHAHGGVTGKRAGKSAIEFPSRSAAASARKQRVGGAVPKKGRASAETDDDDDAEDIATPEDRDDGVEEGDGAAGDDDGGAAAAAVARRHGKAAAKQGRPAALRKGGAMRPVRHDSWDTGFSRRSRSEDGGDDDGGDEDAVEEETETAGEDGGAAWVDDMAPSPPRKRLRKPLKRAAPKRR